jgi:predicted DNA binding CopG/RHH family protein
MKAKRKLSMSRPTQSSSQAERVARELAEGKARLTVDLPEAAHRALKLRAVERGQSIRDYIVELLRADGLKW